MIVRQPYTGIDDQARMVELARSTAADHIQVIDLPDRLSSGHRLTVKMLTYGRIANRFSSV